MIATFARACFTCQRSHAKHASAASASGTKPCTTQMVAVLAAAFAMYGRHNVPAAARLSDPRITDRRLTNFLAVFLP